MRNIQAFFKTYEAAFNAYDAKAIARAYAQSFIMSDGHHPQAMQNDATLLTGIERAGTYYKQLGVQAVKISALEELPIDTTHSLIKTRGMLLKESGSELVSFNAAYVVRDTGETLEFVLVIGNDEETQMRARGLIAQ